jgi:hypothetical protein
MSEENLSLLISASAEAEVISGTMSIDSAEEEK